MLLVHGRESARAVCQFLFRPLFQNFCDFRAILKVDRPNRRKSHASLEFGAKSERERARSQEGGIYRVVDTFLRWFRGEPL